MKSKAHSRIKVEVLVLLSIVLLKLVDVQTNCVLGATAGILEQTAKITPNSEFVHNALANAYYGLNQIDEGDKAFDRAYIIACEKAVNHNPKDVNACLDLGSAYYELENFQAAIETYQRALKVDPDCWEVKRNLADCYASAGLLNESNQMWKQVLEDDPEYAWPHIALAFNYNELGQYDDAIAEWKSLIESEPNVAVIWLLMGNTYTKAGRLDEAKSAYEQAINLNSDSVDVHFHLGKTYLQLSNKEMALAEYETLKALDQELANELYELIEEADKGSEKTGMRYLEF